MIPSSLAPALPTSISAAATSCIRSATASPRRVRRRRRRRWSSSGRFTPAQALPNPDRQHHIAHAAAASADHIADPLGVMRRGVAKRHRAAVPFQQQGQRAAVQGHDHLLRLVHRHLRRELAGLVHPMGISKSQLLHHPALLVDAMAIRAQDQTHLFLDVPNHVAKAPGGYGRSGKIEPALRGFRRQPGCAIKSKRALFDPNEARGCFCCPARSAPVRLNPASNPTR